MSNSTHCGSIWRKWDLHIHTPETKLNNQYKNSTNTEWDEYCELIESSDVEAFGITDYFSVENYYKFIEKFKNKYPNSKKVFFQNIEFRLDVAVNKMDENVNLHVIFDFNTDKDKITRLLSNLSVNMTSNNVRITCSELKDKEKFMKASIKYNDLVDNLKYIFGTEKCYLIIAAVNGGGIRTTGDSLRKLNISHEIDKASDGFIGNVRNREFYLQDYRYEDNKSYRSKPVLIGSDAHSFEDLKKWIGKKYIGKTDDEEIMEKDVTWIKADLTFEGLKQIIYEPEGRVHIGKIKSITSINTIDSIQLNIPDDAKIRKDSTEDKFCYAGNNKSYNFSPYYNCIIGGRGSGKSTILNFLGIHSLTKMSSEKFWNEYQPNNFEPNEPDIFKIEGATIFEFLGQNEIDGFARDKNQFTNAIFERILLINGKVFNGYNKKCNELQSRLLNVIQEVKKLEELKTQKLFNEKRLKTIKQAESINISDEYKNINNEIKLKSNDIYEYEVWHEKIDVLRNALNILFDQNNFDSMTSKVSKNIFKDIFDNAILKIKEILIFLDNENKEFRDGIENENKLKGERNNLQQNIEAIIQKAGFTTIENFKLLSSASQQSSEIEIQIHELNLQIRLMEDKINNIDILSKELFENKNKFKSEINDVLKELEKTLKEEYDKNQNDIKLITLTYEFNEEKAWDGICDEFYDLNKEYVTGNSVLPNFKWYVKENRSIFEIDKFQEMIGHINKLQGDNPKYIKFRVLTS